MRFDSKTHFFTLFFVIHENFLSLTECFFVIYTVLPFTTLLNNGFHGFFVFRIFYTKHFSFLIRRISTQFKKRHEKDVEMFRFFQFGKKNEFFPFFLKNLYFLFKINKNHIKFIYFKFTIKLFILIKIK